MEHVVPPDRTRHYGRHLLTALAASGTVLVVELVAAWRTGSLALLADAGHLLVDLSGLILAYLALRWASRPATPQATYGFYRMEVLAAAVNGLLLVGIVFFLIQRAWARLQSPRDIESPGLVLAVAVLGLLANLLAAWLLREDAKENINTRGAFLNVLGDALASVGVIVGAILLRITGDSIWDTAVTFVIAIIIAWSAVQLLRSTASILLETAPPHIDMAQIMEAVETLPGVVNVHDLHVWTLTPGHHAATMHVSIAKDLVPRFFEVLHDIEDLLGERFGLEHCTIQLEPEGDEASDRFDPVHGEMPTR